MSVSMPLKWHGGKSPICKKIKSLFPPHKLLAVPFFGGGSIPLAWPSETVEVVNDLDADLINFYELLKYRGEYLQSWMKIVPHNEDSFLWAKYVCENEELERSPMNRAGAYFIRNRMSRQAAGKCFCTPTSRLRRGMEEHLSAWLSAVDSLSHFSKRLANVELRNQDFLPFMQEFDSVDTLFYCDPPYLAETRVAKNAYTFEMDAEQHCCLLNFLAGCLSKFVLSGYGHELYTEMALASGWRTYVIETPVHSSGKRSKRIAEELLFTNF